ncbi:MAG: M10 family metallopeptidase C-terminal domain-containing protein [Methyloceanibacter sp.]|uniref:M10 family metallopeptidase C-terminal domain-containing protein n=1 Tax=Methyloceanibacter sp. TaxID=1965321 RepID=UPI003D6CFD43
MTDYFFLGGDLSDVNRYRIGSADGPTATMLPMAGDTVTGSGSGGNGGSLSVDEVINLTITHNATVTADSATTLVTVGNVNAVGGGATMTINGTVAGAATVWGNGTLTADTITGNIQGRGGTITLNNDLNVGGDSGTIDVSLQGGTMTVDGALDFTGTQSDVSVDDDAILNVDTISFAGGDSTLGITDGGEVNVASAGTLSLNDGDAISLTGGTLDASGLAVEIDGSAFNSRGEMFVDRSPDGTQSEASIASLDVTGFGLVRSLGGLLDVAGDVDIGVTADGGRVEVFDFSGPLGTLKAQNITVGNGMGTVDHCGDWTYAGTSGVLAVSTKGYTSIADTLILDNANDSGIGLFDTSSFHVGGDGGYVPGQFLVDGNGKVIGHGTISAPSIVVNGGGTISAANGTLVLDSEVTGTGTLQIDDSAILVLTDDCSVDVAFLDRADTSLAHSSILKFDDPANFSGSISGLSTGCTIELNGDMLDDWTGLANPTLAHTEIQAGQLILTFINDVAGNIVTGPGAVTKTISLDNAPDDHVFTIREFFGGDYALSFTDASDQVITGLDGRPTVGAHPYIDALVNGWAKWDKDAGPITFWFGEQANLDAAIDVHGTNFDLGCDDTVDGWSQDEVDAVMRSLDLYTDITGIQFDEAGSVEEANFVFWQKPLFDGAAAGSDFISKTVDGHLWLIFDQTQWSEETLNFGGYGQLTITHEIGHALGLVHPHDGGSEPDRGRFPGVFFNNDQSVGTNAQNQAIFTAMSYKQGWTGEAPPPAEFGQQGGLGAFDIAALKALYGLNENTNAGDDVYFLPDSNVIGTGWQAIWDTGGEDTISNFGSTLGATIDLRAAPLLGVNAGGFVSHAGGILGGFTIANDVVIENAVGGNGHDTLIGNDADNTLEGSGGNDTLIGGLGADTLVGGDGHDTYHVDAADTIIEGTSEGLDTVVSSSMSLSLVNYGNVENLMLQGSGGFSLIGNSGVNTLTGNAGANSLNGLDGNDKLLGQSGNDTLRGGIGDDALTGGAGRDTMFGDAGKDMFDFNSIKDSKKGGQRDKISHFQRGQDDIDLKGIDAKKGGGNQKFKWIGKNDFHDKKGELRYEDKGSKVIVQGDVNGDGKADFEIFVAVGALSKGDFFL